MRASILIAAPLLAVAASAQSVSVSIPEHPLASLLTQTDSNGVITGQPAVQTSQPGLPPAVTSQPPAVTTQPPPASIPAGLPSGLHTLHYGNATSFTISVGDNTTVVLGPGGPPTGTNTQGTDSNGNPTGTGTSNPTGNPSNSQTGPVTTTTSPGAAAVNVASGFLAGAAAFIAAFL